MEIRRIFYRRPDGADELKASENLLQNQIASIGLLILSYVFVRLVEWWAPGFFRHPNLTWTTSFDNLSRFWSLFAYAAGAGTILNLVEKVRSSRYDEDIFRMHFITSVLAGTWEEIVFRWLYICAAMVGLVFTNWLFGTAFGTIIGLLFIFMGFVALRAGGVRSFIGMMIAAWGCFLVWLVHSGQVDPIYWLYGHVIVPLVSLTTFRKMDPVLYNQHLAQFFVFGAISANMEFRDGHKYLGIIGMVNSWYFGLVMIYAMVFYGIGTAIVLHAIYDVELGLIRYLVRKMRG